MQEEKYPYSAKLAVGITIKSASGNLPVLSEPNSTIMTLNRQITTSVLHVRKQPKAIPCIFHPETTYEDLTEFTFQFIVQVK